MHEAELPPFEQHRRRLERRKAAGQVTDAEYAARLAELDAWERGLAQVRAAGGRP